MDQEIGRPLKDIVREDKDNKSEFVELLESASINPHLSWEAQRDSLALEPRYLALSCNADRKEAFSEWKQNQTAELSKEDQKCSAEKYVGFIHSKYTPGMLYAVFKRKFRNDPGFAASQVSQIEKEALFQEYKMVLSIESTQEMLEYIKARPLFSLLAPALDDKFAS